MGSGRQESSFRYTKNVDWTDSSGTPQTCQAKRQVNFVGPDGVLARTQLVGQYGLNAAALWTIGGENPAQWPGIRGYAQSLAPAEAVVAIAVTPAAVFGQPTSIAGGVTFNGAPVPNVPVTVEFQPSGSEEWQALQVAASGPDGAVAFQVLLPSSGRVRLTVPETAGIAASQSPAAEKRRVAAALEKQRRAAAAEAKAKMQPPPRSGVANLGVLAEPPPPSQAQAAQASSPYDRWRPRPPMRCASLRKMPLSLPSSTHTSQPSKRSVLLPVLKERRGDH